MDVYIHMYPTIVRTFLFVGFPFMFAGYYIKKNDLESKSFFKGNGMIVLTMLFLVLLLVES